MHEKVISENEPASYDLMKESIQVKLAANTTRDERLQVANSMLAVIEDKYLVLADTVSLVGDMRKNMKIIDFFGGCTRAVCFVLGMFQLIMTISANIKDSMWELGVLRSMGCKRS